MFIQRSIVIPVICSFMFAFAAFAAEKERPRQQPTQQQTHQPAQQQIQIGNPAVNPITQAAVMRGALQCASRINQVVNFLTLGSQGVGAHVYVSPANPDHMMLSVSLEVQNANMPTAYASAVFAPNQANGCGAMYKAVVYWNMKCDDVLAKQFAGLKNIGAILKEITVLDGGPALKVFLMPAGSGCISIKQESVQ